MKSQTRIHYAQRLELVLDWLARHPDEDPDLYRLAELASLSPFHFHRVYRAMMGETVVATVQRVRLNRASVDLQSGNKPLAQVAQRAGYASTAAFSRVFGVAFGLPPGRYRVDRSRSFSQRMEPLMYPIHIENFSGQVLAALEHAGDYQKIGSSFDRLFMLASSRKLIPEGARSFGVYYDDPAQVEERKLRSVAGVTVAESAVLTPPLQCVALPAGRCAVLDYTGPYSELESAYTWLFGEWLPQSGEQPGDVPVFEEYVNDPKTTLPAELKTRIYLMLVS